MRDRPDEILLSAYLDGEVPEQHVAYIEHAIADDPECRARYEKLQSLRRTLRGRDVPDLRARMTASFASIQRRVSVLSISQHSARRRQVRIPVPALAAAAAAFVAVVGVLIWSLIPSAPATTPDYLTQGKDIDVTINVDDVDMENVLEWLVEREMLGEISIELPPDQQFQIMGEPVLLKPDDYPEGFFE